LDGGEARLLEDLDSGGRRVTALAWAFGSQTLLVGDERGIVSGGQGIRTGEGSSRALSRVRGFPRAGGAISAFAPARRDKSFLVVDRKGGVRLDHVTTERTLAAGVRAPGGDSVAAIAPKRDGALVGAGDGTLLRLDVRSRHPEVNLRAL